MRSNVAHVEDEKLVPGEVLYKFDPWYFDTRANRPPEYQLQEQLYYVPCSLCRRASNDPACQCASLPPTAGAAQMPTASPKS